MCWLAAYKVAASTPKELFVVDNIGTCLGTEYVLGKLLF